MSEETGGEEVSSAVEVKEGEEAAPGQEIPIITKHSDLFPLARNQCPHCFAQFTLEKSYVDHMWSVHGSRRPFRCDDCGIFLSYRSSLYNHRKIHSDKRPFACTECNAKFRWNNSLKYHMTRAHQKFPPFSVSGGGGGKSRRGRSQTDENEISSSDSVVSSSGTGEDAARIFQLLISASGDAANLQTQQNPRKNSRKPSRPRQILSRPPEKLEPRQCEGCGKKFFLPEALEAHKESCSGQTAPPLALDDTILNGAASTSRDAECMEGMVLSERLSQICQQQEALMRRLEGFEHWVQERVGKMETILTAIIAQHLQHQLPLNQ